MATSNVEENDPLEALGNLFRGGDEPDPNDPSAMSLVDHLEELRWRIFKSLIAIAICSVVAFVFREQIMNFLTRPLPAAANALSKNGHVPLIVTGLGEGFTTFLLLAIAVGFIASLPVVLYQTWAFIAPGLYYN